MATIDWTGAAGDGNWDTADNWSGDVLPGPSDAVVIPSGFDVTHDDDDTDKIASLSVAAGDTLSIGSGWLAIASASTIDGTLAMTGLGNLSGDVSVGTLDQTGGDFQDGFSIGATTDVTVIDSATVEAFLWNGPGMADLLGTTTIGPEADLNIEQEWVLENNGDLTFDGGNIETASATIDNTAGHTFDITGAGDIGYASGAPDDTSVFDNAGLLETDGLTGTVTIGVVLDNTGTVDVTSGGTIDLAAGGTLGNLELASGATLNLLSGVYTMSSGPTDAGTFWLDGEPGEHAQSATGATLDLTGPVSFDNFDQSLDAVLSSTANVTISGAAEINAGYQTGSGTTDVLGGLGADGLYIEDGREVENSGSGGGDDIFLGYDPVNQVDAGTGTFDNAAGATFEIGGGVYGPGSDTSGDAFNNAGLLISGAATIDVPFDNTGTVDVISSTLDVTGSLSGDGSFEVFPATMLILPSPPPTGSSLQYSASGLAPNNPGTDPTPQYATGTIALQDPGSTITELLADLAPGDVLELPGTTVESLVIGKNSLEITTDSGAYDFTNVSYSGPVASYTAATDPHTGLLAITFNSGRDLLDYIPPSVSFPNSDLLLSNDVTGGDAVGLMLAGKMGFEQIGFLGPEWQFEGDGSFIGAGDGELLWNDENGALFVDGSQNDGNFQYTQIGGLGGEWQFEGTGAFDGGSTGEFLLWNSENGGVVVGTVANASVQYTQIGALGAEWKFEGTGDYLGDNRVGFLLWNSQNDSVVVGEDVSGTAQYTSIGGLGSEWVFEGTGPLLGHTEDDFLIWDKNNGALYAGEVVNGAAQYTQIGALGPEWQFLGTGNYDGKSSAEFMLRNGNSGALVLGTVANNTATYTVVGNVGPEWNFHTGNVATVA